MELAYHLLHTGTATGSTMNDHMQYFYATVTFLVAAVMVSNALRDEKEEPYSKPC